MPVLRRGNTRKLSLPPTCKHNKLKIKPNFKCSVEERFLWVTLTGFLWTQVSFFVSHVMSDFNEKWWQSIQVSPPAYGASPHFIALTGQEIIQEFAAQLFQIASAQVMSAPNYWTNACINWKGSFSSFGKSIVFLTIKVFVRTVLSLWNKLFLCISFSWKTPTIFNTQFMGAPNLPWTRFSVTYSHRTLHAPFDKPHLICMNYLLVQGLPAFTTGSRALGTGPVRHVSPMPITCHGI